MLATLVIFLREGVEASMIIAMACVYVLYLAAALLAFFNVRKRFSGARVAR